MELIAVTSGAFTGVINHAIREVGNFDVCGINSLSGLDRISGVVFSGGGDVNPERYGEKIISHIWGVDNRRDTLEFALATECLERGIPILGICRGHQVLGVHSGTKLIPDISANHSAFGPRGSSHHYIQGPLSEVNHTVNSLHHQAVPNTSDIADYGIEVLATADNNEIGDQEIVEAMRGPGFVSCQWHPELDWMHHQVSRQVFEMFVGMVNGG